MSYRDLLLKDTNALHVSDDRVQVMPLDDVVSNGLGQIIKLHARAYRDVVIHTHDLALMRKPFNKAIVVRLLARRQCWLQDDQGRKQPVTGLGFLRLGWRLLAAHVIGAYRKHRFIGRVSKLETNPQQFRKKQGVGIPLYLRSDLVFGLISGGSVTHISGVINSLITLKGGVHFLTTDVIPTVSDAALVRIVRPEARFSDLPETRQLLFSEYMEQVACQELKQECPAFIYQRYSVNNITGVLLAEQYKVPFVLEYNGSEVWINRNWGRALADEKTALRLEIINFAAADLIVVVSKVLADELVERGVEPERILVNPNGVDPDRYRPDINGGAVRAHYGLGGTFVVGFIGTFGPWHGAEILAEAVGEYFQKNPAKRGKVKFLFIGDGQGLPEVQRIVERNNVADECVFTGLISQQEGPEHMAACDILVSPHVPNIDGSRFFGSPTKLFEYMAMGKPIVASKLEQLSEVLTHKSTAWLVPPGDVAALVDGIEQVYADADLGKLLAENARKVACQKHTWLRHTERILEALDNRCPAADAEEGF
ncbi:MAG: glycosyltransferase [Desulfobulbaceae bacterium]|nr:glycosyltransferase [Desulfobulbaceae bacterium]